MSLPSALLSIADFTPTPHSEMSDSAPAPITPEHLHHLLTQLQQQNAALRQELNNMWNQGSHIAGFVSATVQQTLQQNPLPTPTNPLVRLRGLTLSLSPEIGKRQKASCTLSN
jgi:hypothetical protein